MKVDFKILLILISLVVLAGCTNQNSNYPVANSENCKDYCPTKNFPAWTEFSEEPKSDFFDLHIPISDWNEHPQVLTSDCSKELRKRTGITQTEGCGICRIGDVTVTDDATIGCECYYGRC
ncbi:hypothetical protein HYX17_02490 [Candidatus Woesearchaeota archaeon]|nr:hypothetical protein [Candidatus Woesearchaeota archaeon]